MKKLIILVVSIIALSCQREYIEPTFNGVSQIEFDKLSGTKAHVKGIAHFHNPNKQQLKLKKVDVDVLLKDKIIGNINQNIDIKIPSKSSFEIPLNANFNLSDIGLMSGLLMFISGNDLDLDYKGEIIVSYYGVPQRIPIEYQASVNIKQ